MTPTLVLASGSPRRRELLALLNVPFTVQVSAFDEDSIATEGRTPAEWVVELAAGKARAVAALSQNQAEDALVLGADTTVVLDGAYLNKPADAADARRMLRLLSARTHQVYTGLALVQVQQGTVHAVGTDHARADVSFAALTEAAIDAYVATSEPLDKAGAYGIQGTALSFIPAIHGDYYAVMGLPLENVRGLLLPFFPNLSPAPPPPFPASA